MSEAGGFKAVEQELRLISGNIDEDLGLVPFDDLLAEIKKRCEAGVFAFRIPFVDDDGREDPEKRRRYVLSWGDWDVLRGLSESLHEQVMEEHHAAFHPCECQDGDGE